MQGVKVEIDPIWLRDQYVNKSKTFQDIASELGCNADTVRERAHSIGIKVRTRSEMTLKTRSDKVPIDKDWLYNKYINQGLSMASCAELVGVSPSVIQHRLKEYGIESHNGGYWKRIGVDECWLRENYVNKNLSGRTCAKLAGVVVDVILDRLDEFNIPKKTRAESLSGKNGTWYGKKLTEAHRRHISRSIKGPKHYNWQGGKSSWPYCEKFNFELKEEIREAYGRRCPLCDRLEGNRRLSIHHIDFDKMQGCNGRKWNLIPLCTSCHAKTQFDRWYWFNLLYNHWLLNPNINFRMSTVTLIAGK